jgi:SAM-dependent methyltransferase
MIDSSPVKNYATHGYQHLGEAILSFLKRTLYSPRWQWLRGLVGRYVISGDPESMWLRQVMNRETEKLVAGLNPQSLKVCEISGTNWNKPGFFREHVAPSYPEFDICNGPYPDRFDLVIAEQVFEHLLWPYRAGRNVYEMLNPGGHLLISTPFLLKIHNHPVDCSRWTELGMKHFLAECGFPLDKIQTSSWGNKSCVKANLGPRWVVYDKTWHSLENDPEYPIVVWALATK